jgi:hypothetical protein
MKTLIYQVDSYSHIYNEETNELEKQLSLALVTVENPTGRDIEQASKVAYKGKYTIEDDGQPDQWGASVWDELDAAYQEGVDSV